MTSNLSPWPFLLAMTGMGIMAWQARRYSGAILFGLASVALALYVGFNNSVHVHEWTHYYLGSKYTTELSYTRLYECLTVADLQDGVIKPDDDQLITDLHTNRTVVRDHAIDDQATCTSHFSAERWQAFRNDVSYLRNLAGDDRKWRAIRTDHGYNATPVWTIAGTLLTNTGPASDIQVFFLGLLDPLFLVAMLLAIGWAFGWRTTSVATIALSTYFPARYDWTGGAFLRWDWLCCLVLAVCLLKKGRPYLAGIMLGYAALLRIFPGVVFCLAVLGLMYSRPLDRTWSRFLIGGVGVAIVLVPVSLLVTDGFGTYQAFFENLAKTAGTPFTNAIGLPSVLSWRQGESITSLRDPQALEPIGAWLEARHRAASETGVPHVLIAGIFVRLFVLAIKHSHPWIVVALSTMILPAVTDLLSYYYVLIVATALIHHDSKRDTVWLLGLCTASHFIAIAPIPGMPTSPDEQYMLISVATLITFAVILTRRGKRTPVGAESFDVMLDGERFGGGARGFGKAGA